MRFKIEFGISDQGIFSGIDTKRAVVVAADPVDKAISKSGIPGCGKDPDYSSVGSVFGNGIVADRNKVVRGWFDF